MSMTENVRQWLEGEGFPLEMRVAAAFRKTGFDVRQSSLYTDPESAKNREIDVIATDPDHIGIVEIHFVVECKSSKKPWVLLTSEDVLSNYNRLFALGVLSKDVLKSFAHRTGELMETLPWLRKSSRSGYALRHAFSGSHDFAYSAAMSVAKACDSLVRQPDARYIAPFILAFPVIVIDTPLFECTLKSNGQIQLDEVSQGEFLFVARLPSRFGACIRVITDGNVQTFAQEARKAAEQFRAALKPEEDRIMETWSKS
jgi:hypothetical protein